MRRLLIAAACCVSVLTSAQATILTLYSDNGVPAGTMVDTWCTQSYSGGTCPSYLFTGQYPDATAPEGFNSFQTTFDSNNNSAGWGVIYPGLTNISAFGNGELRFWLYSNTADLELQIQHVGAGGTQDTFDLSGIAPYLNQWVLVALPLNYTSLSTGEPVVLSDIYSPFEITSLSGGTYYVDDVRLVNQVGGIDFQVSVNDISDGSPASNITWNTSLPAGWTRANQYINVEIDPDDDQTWGVQIYTNNAAAGANPQFSTTVQSGQPGSNPAGLINASNVSQALPMAWNIEANTSTPPTAADPNSFPVWLPLQDQNTPTISAQNTTVFAPGEVFAQVKNNLGIHYIQGTALSSADFGAQNPPNPIYLEANFANASAGTYQTSTLTVELFTP